MTGRTTAEILAEVRDIEAARAMNGAPAVVIPDPLVQYREDAEADLAADEAEKLRRVRAAKLDQMARVRATAEIDMNERVRVAVAREVGAVLDTLMEAVGSAIGELIKQSMDPIETKLATMERLLDRLQSLTAPAGRSLGGDHVNVN
jgi:hypothetical protein